MLVGVVLGVKAIGAHTICSGAMQAAMQAGLHDSPGRGSGARATGSTHEIWHEGLQAPFNGHSVGSDSRPLDNTVTASVHTGTPKAPSAPPRLVRPSF